MQYAERLGLPGVRARIETFAAADPLSWALPDLLRRAAETGRSLSDLARTP